MGSERYVRVTAELIRINPRSFIVKNSEGEEVVVGRSCVHGVDEQAVAASTVGDDVEFRVFEWLAEKEGLL